MPAHGGVHGKGERRSSAAGRLNRGRPRRRVRRLLDRCWPYPLVVAVIFISLTSYCSPATVDKKEKTSTRADLAEIAVDRTVRYADACAGLYRLRLSELFKAVRSCEKRHKTSSQARNDDEDRQRRAAEDAINYEINANDLAGLTPDLQRLFSQAVQDRWQVIAAETTALLRRADALRFDDCATALSAYQSAKPSIRTFTADSNRLNIQIQQAIRLLKQEASGTQENNP